MSCFTSARKVVLHADAYHDPRAVLIGASCRAHGIPLDTPIPAPIAGAVMAAIDLAAWPDEARPLWDVAEAWLAEWRATDALAAEVAAAEQRFSHAA